MTSRPLPSPVVVFLVFGAIALCQLPATFLIQGGNIWQAILYSQTVAIPLPIIAIMWWKRYPHRVLFPLERTSWKSLVLIFVVTIPLAYGMHYGVELTQQIFNAPPIFEVEHASLLQITTGWELVGKMLVLALLPAIVEEGFYRGFFQTALARDFGARQAMWWSAGTFALSHGSYHYWHLYLLLGLYLSFLRRRGGNLWWPALAHFVNNGWTILYYAYVING
jgi:membrane protease YdiL (CAAX protease family)